MWLKLNEVGSNYFNLNFNLMCGLLVNPLPAVLKIDHQFRCDKFCYRPVLITESPLQFCTNLDLNMGKRVELGKGEAEPCNPKYITQLISQPYHVVALIRNDSVMQSSKLSLSSITVISGWQTRECHWLVPQSPGVWLLAVRHWCLHSNAQPELPGTFCGHSNWPCQNHLRWESLPWSF